MLELEKIITENQKEFIELVVKFVSEKTTPKRKKSPKTTYHFLALGKAYDSDIVKRNYEEFLIDASKILDYKKCEQILKGFIKKDESEFKESYKGGKSIINLNNGGVVSSHSGNGVKVKHIKGLCDLMRVNLEVIKCK